MLQRVFSKHTMHTNVHLDTTGPPNCTTSSLDISPYVWRKRFVASSLAVLTKFREFYQISTIKAQINATKNPSKDFMPYKIDESL